MDYTITSIIYILEIKYAEWAKYLPKQLKYKYSKFGNSKYFTYLFQLKFKYKYFVSKVLK